MKRFVSLVLAAVLVCTLLSVFVLPASAAEESFKGTKIISGAEEYGDMTVNGTLLVKKDAVLTVDILSAKGQLILEPGAKIIANNINISGVFSSVPSGATIEVKGTLEFSSNSAKYDIFLEPGAVVKAKTVCDEKGICKLTVCAGATLLFANMEGFNNTNYSSIDLYGTLKSTEAANIGEDIPDVIHYHEGAVFDVSFVDDGLANSFAEILGASIQPGNRVYKHDGHIIDKTCVNCGAGTAEDYMAAGVDLEYEGRYEDAADAYLKAANLYEDADDPDSAAEAYQNAGQAFFIIASQYQDEGNSVAAADAYMKAGECFEKAGDFTNAGVAFSCITNLMNKVNLSSIVVAYAKTGECLEKANDLSNAKDAFGFAALAAQDKVNELQNGSTGSILSGGSLVIICSVACLVVGALGMYLIMKKKKPAVAGGEKNEE